MYKVLLIDDELVIIEGLKKLVPWEEVECELVGVAEDGLAGIELTKKLAPDIVISDIRMPKLPGLEMIKKIKQTNKQTKFIILTGHREFEYAKQAINLGVVKFLLKPTSLEDIKNAVLDVIREIDDEKTKVTDIENLRKQLKKYSMMSESEPMKKSDETDDVKYLTREAVEFIKQNYNKKIDLQAISDHLYISTWYLCKLLKKEIGNSFIELLNEVRIQNAKKLLVESNKKIYNIAEMVGYTDIPYFTKTFKKHVGITPNQYRNKKRTSRLS